jgi:hypothetical protein
MSEAVAIPNTGVIDQTPPAENKFEIPAEYQDRAYLKDVTSIDDVYKKLDGAQSLIGQKIIFPTENSTPEEILQFNKAAGMPEKAEDYTFEKLGEKERVAEYDAKVKELFHKYGISGKAATGFTKDYESLIDEVGKVQTEQSDKEFGELSKKVLGEKMEEIIASGKKLLEENLPEEFAEDFKNLPNKQLVLMASVLNNFKTKYIDEGIVTPPSGSITGKTKEQLNTEVQDLMKDPAYKDGLHKNHQAVNDKITDLCNQIAKIEG